MKTQFASPPLLHKDAVKRNDLFGFGFWGFFCWFSFPQKKSQF